MNTKRVAILALITTLALMMSYIEFLIPIPVPVPGIKLGLANIVTVFVLYSLSPNEAVAVTAVRVILCSLLFNVGGMIYSVCGAAVSLVVMILLQRTRLFSETGVSIAGAIAHNAAQILVAVVLMNTVEIIYYLPVLIVSGAVSGLVIGILAGIIVRRTKNSVN